MPFLSIPYRYYQTLAIIISVIVLWNVNWSAKEEDWSGADDEDAGRAEDWAQFAYVQYVDNVDQLCNAVMLFDSLDRLESKAERLLLYPESLIDATGDSSKPTELFLKAQDEYGVNLHPVKEILHDTEDPYWAETYNKIIAFSVTSYSRVLVIDTDSTVLQNLDHLFLLPSSAVTMPRAYWTTSNSSTPQLSTQLMLITPSLQTYARLWNRLRLRLAPPPAEGLAEDAPPAAPFPSDVATTQEITEHLAERFSESAMVLPARTYNLLTAELRRKNHTDFLGMADESDWDAAAVVREANFVHFSDWPLPKPWALVEMDGGREMMEQYAPEGKVERRLWMRFYEDFLRRRVRVCGMGGVRDEDEDGEGDREEGDDEEEDEEEEPGTSSREHGMATAYTH